MKILFIAPFPPPLAGHSLVAKVFYDGLRRHHKVIPVDFNKESFVEGISSINRIFEILAVLKRVYLNQKKADRIYLTISESFAGNLKDLFIYILCYNKLNRFYIHLHGGSIKRTLWDKYPFLNSINRFFIKRMAGVILSGESHKEVFADKLPEQKTFIVPNFALDELFSSKESVLTNFSNLTPIRLLYMSNMIDKKGYLVLANAYLSLEAEVRKNFRLDFAGRFEFESQKAEFTALIDGHPDITYHGVVSDTEKERLFKNSHVFCLPTSYFEGQPVSILEAYAAGSIVLTTPQSGILDIFDVNRNGYLVIPGSSESISEILTKISSDKSKLADIALFNREEAMSKYRPTIYNANLLRIMELPVES